MLDAALLVVGLVLLYQGAEWLVAGSAGLARSLGMRPLIVGLTVVAYGTSAPELVVGVQASYGGQGAIALGNIIGSNVANLALILGMTALILPPAVDRTVVRREVPVLLVTTAVLPLVLLDGELARWEATLMLAVALGYTGWMVLTSRVGSVAQAGAVAEDASAAAGIDPDVSRVAMILRGVTGLAMLVGGGHLLVEGAVGIARSLGMSERVIGLTIVAVGTSLPELATSLIAAARGHADIAVGNVIGSNIFNILLIGGASGLAGRIAAPIDSVAIDLYVLGGVTAFAALAMRTSYRVGRAEGVVLVLTYFGFMFSLLVG